MRSRRRAVLKAALAFSAVGAGLAGAPVRADAQTVIVAIRDYKYLPDDLMIKVGTTVKWVNEEKRTSHSVLFLGPDGFESERLFPGDSWQRRFTEKGDYPYRCGPHPEMRGRVVVA